MKVYIDTCCYGRPYDDHTEPNTKAQSDAILEAIEYCKAARLPIIGSAAVEYEIGLIRDTQIRSAIMKFYNDTIDERVVLTDGDVARAQSLQVDNIGVLDSHHLAGAERVGADFLLTTDVKFLRRVANKSLSMVNVVNPLNFSQEVVKWAQ